jgi:hypothetical protein
VDVSSSISSWQAKNFEKYKYTAEPDYYPVTFSVDKLNRTEIQCTSPIFDIGISDSLRLILGLYEQEGFSLKRYERRRKFHSTLRRNIGRLEGLQSQYVKPLSLELEWDPTIQNMLRVAAVLDLNFRRLWLHVRLAKLCDNPDSSVITGEAVKTILAEPLSKTWPKDDRVWAPYLDTKEFYQYVANVKKCNGLRKDLMDDSLFGTQYTTTPGFCGLVTAMFMLKTIYTETLMGRPLFAEMPGQINPHEFMQIYMDVVRPEPFNGLMTSLLALVKTEGRPGETARYEATRIQYKSLAVKDISGLKVLILSPSGIPIPFQRGPVLIQLHFIRTQRSVQLY